MNKIWYLLLLCVAGSAGVCGYFMGSSIQPVLNTGIQVLNGDREVGSGLRSDDKH